MLGPQRIQGFYPTNHYFYPNPRTSTYPSTLIDVKWSISWPTIRSILLGGVMLLTNAAIVGLDIANLAIEGTKDPLFKRLGYGTSKVGAGIWSGSISFLAAIFIIVIIFVRNKRAAATFALIVTSLAFLFSIVLIGLTANAIQLDQYEEFTPYLDRRQYRLIIAILSLAAFNVTLCLVFFLMYINVFFSPSTRQVRKH